ncbi:hypothetical protein ACKKBG_A22455 [Auxenochlorella protothecoides x Auxenochlorella symbiontica]
MEGVVRVLSRLSHLGQELQATGLSEDGVTTALSSYMSDNLLETSPYWVASAGEALWARLQEAGAGLPHISRALAAIITHSSHDHAVGAVELCFGLLAVDKCPTRGIFDRVLCSSYLGWLRGVQSSGPTAKKRAGRKGKKAAAMDTDEDEAMDVDQEHPSPLASSLAGFAGTLRTLGLADQPDVVQDAASTCVDLICKGGASTPQEVSAAYGVLLSLLQPIHGNPRDLCAMVFRHLASGLAAMGGGGGKVARAEVCHQLIAFASSALGQSPSAATESVAALARAVVLRAADRADARTAAVELAMGLLGLLGPAEGEAFVVFTARLSRTPKVSQRMMAVDLAPALLAAAGEPFQTSAAALEAAAATPGAGAGPLVAAPPGAICLAILAQRCGDRAAPVRARALGTLAAALSAASSFNGGSSREESLFLRALSLAHEVRLQRQDEVVGRTPGGALPSPCFVSPAGAGEPGGTPLTGAGAPTTGRTPRPGPTPAPRASCHFTMPASWAGAGGADPGAAGLGWLLRTARRRAGDERGAVRRGAVALLEALLVLRASAARPLAPGPADLAALDAALGDALVSVRRAALGALCALLPVAPEAAAPLWARAGLPLAADPEASVADAALGALGSLLLDPLTALGGGGAGAAARARAAVLPLLRALGDTGGAGAACLAAALAALRRRGTLAAAGPLRGLRRLADAEEASDAAALRGVWLLISKLAEHGVAELPWDFLHHAWLALTAAGESAPAGVAPSLLEAVAHAAGGFPPAEAARLAADLLRALLAFTLAPDAAAAHVAALARLSGPDAAWAPRLAAATRDELAAYVDGLGSARGSPGSNAPGELGPAHARAAAALFLAGELALAGQGGGTTGARLLTLVQTLASDKVLAAATPGYAAPVPPPVQAHAWTALGKMCLMDEALAKLCVPLFVQQLRSAAAPAVRNNIMVALADLVVQFTALVDAHVPALAACITDDNEVVRSQSLALLANLLQKDYVKWRGPLFHRFLLALVDESPAVARMAEYLLGDALSSQAPNLAYNHFVESFFVLNACREGPGAGAAVAACMDLDAATGASVCGGGGGDAPGRRPATRRLDGASPEARAARASLYSALLRSMTPEHRFASAARLTAEVLAGAADGALPLSAPGAAEVLGDALRALGSPDMRVAGAAAAAAGEGEEPDAAAALGAARGRLVSQLMRKHLAESVVPVVIDLRRVLESARSPLLADLMLCARVMLKDHKDEIEDILVADRQLAKELLYDMRQAELAATKSMHVAAVKAEPRRSPAAPRGTPPGTPAAASAAAERTVPRCATPIADEVLRGARGSGDAGTPHVAAGTPPGHKTPAPGTAVRLLSRLGRSDGSHCSSGARASGMTPGTEPRLARAAREKQIIVKDEPEVVQAEEQMLALSLPGVAGTPLRQWNPTLAEEMHPGGAAGGGPKVCMEGPGTDRVKGGARKRGLGG